MTKPTKPAAAPTPADLASSAPSAIEQPGIRDQFAIHAMGAIIMGIISRGADKSVLVDACDDDALPGIAYQCADSAMRARAKL